MEPLWIICPTCLAVGLGEITHLPGCSTTTGIVRPYSSVGQPAWAYGPRQNVVCYDINTGQAGFYCNTCNVGAVHWSRIHHAFTCRYAENIVFNASQIDYMDRAGKPAGQGNGFVCRGCGYGARVLDALYHAETCKTPEIVGIFFKETPEKKIPTIKEAPEKIDPLVVLRRFVAVTNGLTADRAPSIATIREVNEVLHLAMKVLR